MLSAMKIPLRRSSLRSLVLVIGLSAGSPVLACNVASSTLAFGTINPLTDGQRDSTATITVTCPAMTSYTVTLSAGAGSYAQRTLLSGTRVLDYNLFIDAQRTQVWGDGSGMTWTVNGSAGASGTSHTVYGSVPSQPRAVPGTYADTVIITVTY